MLIFIIQKFFRNCFFHTLTRLWQLTAGSLLAVWLIDKKFNQNIIDNKFLMFSGFAIIVGAALFISDELLYPGYLSIIPVAGSLMVIISNTRFSQYGGLVKLGLIATHYIYGIG